MGLVHALDAEARLAAKRKEMEAVEEKARPIQLEAENSGDDNPSDEENPTAPTKSYLGTCPPPPSRSSPTQVRGGELPSKESAWFIMSLNGHDRSLEIPREYFLEPDGAIMYPFRGETGRFAEGGRCPLPPRERLFFSKIGTMMSDVYGVPKSKRSFPIPRYSLASAFFAKSWLKVGKRRGGWCGGMDRRSGYGPRKSFFLFAIPFFFWPSLVVTCPGRMFAVSLFAISVFWHFGISVFHAAEGIQKCEHDRDYEHIKQSSALSVVRESSSIQESNFPLIFPRPVLYTRTAESRSHRCWLLPHAPIWPPRNMG